MILKLKKSRNQIGLEEKVNSTLPLPHSLYTKVMLVLILIHVQYSQKAVFSLHKGSNRRNHPSLDSLHPAKKSPPPYHCGWEFTHSPPPFIVLWKTLHQWNEFLPTTKSPTFKDIFPWLQHLVILKKPKICMNMHKNYISCFLEKVV